MTSERVRTVDGVELAVYDFGGPSGGPSLLLAHATGFHARCWLPVVSVLRSTFHCYAFDERAHGDSTAPANGAGFDWHRFADDALAVVDHFGLSSPYAVGHSCGGALLLLAEIARPGTFAGLYCFEPVVIPSDDVPPGPVSGNPLAASARRRRSEFPSLEAALENYRGKRPMSGFAPEALEAYVEHGFSAVAGESGGAVRLKCRGENEARTYEFAMSHGAYTRLGSVRCPVTLAYGEKTDAFGGDVMALLDARLPSSRVEVLPGLTHFAPQEDPAGFAKRVLAAFAPA